MGLVSKFNPSQLEMSLRQIGEQARKGMSMKMRKAIIRMRDLARDYAPVLSGDLERAIDFEAIKDGRRDAFVLFVNLDALHGSHGKVVGDYAYLMEENLRPYGRKSSPRSYSLGKGSIAKRAGGKKVGGRFLARAISEVTKDLVEEMADEVRRVTSSYGGRILPMNHEGRAAPDDEE